MLSECRVQLQQVLRILQVLMYYVYDHETWTSETIQGFVVLLSDLSSLLQGPATAVSYRVG